MSKMFKVNPPVKPRTQPFSTCCWLTCLEMMFIWKNERGDKSKDYTMILSDMDKSPELFPYYMKDAGISASECRNTAKMLGLSCSGDTKILEKEQLFTMLATHGPLWIAGKFSKESSHVIVVTGCEIDTGRIKIINPWNNYSLGETPQTVEWLQERGDPWTNCDASIMYWMF